jgi:hypothetical protein
MKRKEEEFFMKKLIVIIAGVFLLLGCGPVVTKTVQLNRDRYVCKIDAARYADIEGKRVLLHSIIDESKNTTNLTYYNPERTTDYELLYSSSHTWRQPVVSYFWYALKKGFQCAGIRIEEAGPVYDAEFWMTINSLTDEEMKFRLVMTKRGAALHQKDYVVTVPRTQSRELSVLEQRGYSMLDSIVDIILSDPHVKENLK